jgi:hypothetical protein
MVSGDSTVHGDAGRPEVLLSWVVHPAQQRPAAVFLTLGYLGLATLALQAGLHTPWMTVVGAFVLGGAAAEFLAPSTYRLTTAGAERTGLVGGRRIAWPAVRKAYRFDNGVKLSTLARPGLLEAYRGLWLPWAEHRDEVLRLVDRLAAERLRPVAGEGEE